MNTPPPSPPSCVSEIKRLADGRYLVTRLDGVNFSLTPEQWRDVSDAIWLLEFPDCQPHSEQTP